MNIADIVRIPDPASPQIVRVSEALDPGTVRISDPNCPEIVRIVVGVNVGGAGIDMVGPRWINTKARGLRYTDNPADGNFNSDLIEDLLEETGSSGILYFEEGRVYFSRKINMSGKVHGLYGAGKNATTLLFTSGDHGIYTSWARGSRAGEQIKDLTVQAAVPCTGAGVYLENTAAGQGITGTMSINNVAVTRSTDMYFTRGFEIRGSAGCEIRHCAVLGDQDNMLACYYFGDSINHGPSLNPRLYFCYGDSAINGIEIAGHIEGGGAYGCHILDTVTGFYKHHIDEEIVPPQEIVSPEPHFVFSGGHINAFQTCIKVDYARGLIISDNLFHIRPFNPDITMPTFANTYFFYLKGNPAIVTENVQALGHKIHNNMCRAMRASGYAYGLWAEDTIISEMYGNTFQSCNKPIHLEPTAKKIWMHSNRAYLHPQEDEPGKLAYTAADYITDLGENNIVGAIEVGPNWINGKVRGISFSGQAADATWNSTVINRLLQEGGTVYLDEGTIWFDQKIDMSGRSCGLFGAGKNRTIVASQSADHGIYSSWPRDVAAGEQIRDLLISARTPHTGAGIYLENLATNAVGNTAQAPPSIENIAMNKSGENYFTHGIEIRGCAHVELRHCGLLGHRTFTTALYVFGSVTAGAIVVSTVNPRMYYCVGQTGVVGIEVDGEIDEGGALGCDILDVDIGLWNHHPDIPQRYFSFADGHINAQQVCVKIENARNCLVTNSILDLSTVTPPVDPNYIFLVTGTTSTLLTRLSLGHKIAGNVCRAQAVGGLTYGLWTDLTQQWDFDGNTFQSVNKPIYLAAGTKQIFGRGNRAFIHPQETNPGKLAYTDADFLTDLGTGNRIEVPSGAATYDPASIADGAGLTTTVSVNGAQLGDYARASFSNDLQGLIVTAWVSAANTVSVRFQNETGAAIDLASGTLRANVTRP
jgi:hypothetical protein